MKFLLMLLFGLAGAVAAPRTIEIEGPQIEASELSEAIASWSSSEVVVAQSPAPGTARRVSRGQLELWARSAGLPVADLPEALVLERKLRNVEAAEAEALLADAVARATGVSAESIVVELDAFHTLKIPAGPLELSVGGALKTLNKPARYYLRWREREGRSGVEPLPAAVRVQSRMLVAARDLGFGGEASPEDFEIVEGPLPDARFAYVAEPAELEGKKLRRALRRGDPLRRDDLAARPDVERGDVLELTVSRGAVRLRAPARAESSGSVGELIAVRNLAANTRVQGRVVARGAAEAVRR